MKKILMLMFLGMVLVILIGCQTQKAVETSAQEEAPLSQEEADVADSLDDLDDLDQMDKELDADVNFDDLDQLDLE